MKNITKRIKPLLVIGLAIVFVLIAVIGSRLFFQDEKQPVASSFLTSESFPNSKILFPDDWPAHSSLPDEFVLVSASSGHLPIEGTAGWVSKYRFSGGVSDAEMALMEHLGVYDWEIAENTIIEGGGLIAYLHSAQTGAGILIIEPDKDNPGQVLIAFTVYQQERP